MNENYYNGKYNIIKPNMSLVDETFKIRKQELDNDEVFSGNLVLKKDFENLDYDKFSGLSNEVKTKFKKIRPKTMGQALRIDGITPAAVYILLSHLKRKSIKHIA